jgi:hypothetical protein
MNRLNRMLALVVLLATGCAGSPAADDPTTADPFPDDRFLTAEAAGETEGQAKRAALAELAAVFEARVYARTVQQATSWMGEGLPEQFDRQVEQTVRIHTDVRLEGSRIGIVRPDEAAGGFRALAVLNRREAASRWQRELAETAMAIDGQVDALQSVKGRLSRLGGPESHHRPDGSPVGHRKPAFRSGPAGRRRAADDLRFTSSSSANDWPVMSPCTFNWTAIRHRPSRGG